MFGHGTWVQGKNLEGLLMQLSPLCWQFLDLCGMVSNCTTVNKYFSVSMGNLAISFTGTARIGVMNLFGTLDGLHQPIVSSVAFRSSSANDLLACFIVLFFLDNL